MAMADPSPAARDRPMIELERGTCIEQRCDAKAGGEISRRGTPASRPAR